MSDEIKQAIEALAPFAEQADTFDSDGKEFVPDQFEPAFVNHTVGDLRRAREAAAALDRLSGRVTVKALEWEPGVVIRARPLPGMKYIVGTDHRAERSSWWLDGAKDSRGVCATEPEAIAAAQADFEARILAALDTVPASDQADRIATARNDALEDAAKVVGNAPRVKHGWSTHTPTQDELATAIRALKSETSS